MEERGGGLGCGKEEGPALCSSMLIIVALEDSSIVLVRERLLLLRLFVTPFYMLDKLRVLGLR